MDDWIQVVSWYKFITSNDAPFNHQWIFGWLNPLKTARHLDDWIEIILGGYSVYLKKPLDTWIIGYIRLSLRENHQLRLESTGYLDNWIQIILGNYSVYPMMYLKKSYWIFWRLYTLNFCKWNYSIRFLLHQFLPDTWIIGCKLFLGANSN